MARIALVSEIKIARLYAQGLRPYKIAEQLNVPYFEVYKRTKLLEKFPDENAYRRYLRRRSKEEPLPEKEPVSNKERLQAFAERHGYDSYNDYLKERRRKNKTTRADEDAIRAKEQGVTLTKYRADKRSAKSEKPKYVVFAAFLSDQLVAKGKDKYSLCRLLGVSKAMARFYVRGLAVPSGKSQQKFLDAFAPRHTSFEGLMNGLLKDLPREEIARTAYNVAISRYIRGALIAKKEDCAWLAMRLHLDDATAHDYCTGVGIPDNEQKLFRAFGVQCRPIDTFCQELLQGTYPVLTPELPRPVKETTFLATTTLAPAPAVEQSLDDLL